MNSRKPEAQAGVRGGVFVSDLHLFSPRSAAGGILHQLSAVRSSDRCIVLGGDIFDFRWSDQGSHAQTMQAATQWLENLLANTGQAQIRFLAGNHDCHPDFFERLRSLAEQETRFGWCEHHLQIGNSLFLHGDILDSRGALNSYRKRFHHSRPQTGLKQQLYNAVVGMRLHKLVPAVRHRQGITCSRLRACVMQMPLQATESLERVFFGHTHVPVFGFKSQGIRFYNPGAALKHMRAHPQSFEFEKLTHIGATTESTNA